jgi:hypothetical protein
MKTRTIINKRIEFVCTVMNNKVYYSEKERKRIERRMLVLNSLK